MSKANKIELSNVNGALPKPKRLHLEKDADSLYLCPIQLCEHDDFQSQRGCSKHVNNKHSLFFYIFRRKTSRTFKVCPKLFQSANEIVRHLKSDDYLSCSRSNPGARLMPSFSASGEIGEQFTTWLTGSGGGYKKDGPAQHIVSRCLKFLKFCC